MLKHMDLGTQSPVEVREAQSVNGPLAVLNEYYDVYVTQPEDAKWRLDNMHETYLQDMNSKYVYPNVFMSIDDTNKVSQYDTDIKKYAEQKKADRQTEVDRFFFIEARMDLSGDLSASLQKIRNVLEKCGNVRISLNWMENTFF